MPKKFRKDEVIKVPIHLIQDIFDNGYAYMMMIDGSIKKITKDDLYISEDDLNKIIQEENN